MRALMAVVLLVGCSKKDEPPGRDRTTVDPTTTTSTTTTATTTPPLEPSPIVLVGTLPDPGTGQPAILGLREDGNWGLISDEAVHAWAVSPDRTTVVFNGPHPDDSGLTVPLMQDMVDGAEPTALTQTDLWLRQIAFSPTGPQVAVVGGTQPVDDDGVYVLSLAGDAPILAWDPAVANIWIEQLEWRDDGAWFKFMAYDSVYVSAVDGTTREVTSLAFVDPMWQPAGPHLTLVEQTVLQMYDPALDAVEWDMDPGSSIYPTFGWAPDGQTRWWVVGLGQRELYLAGPDPTDNGTLVHSTWYDPVPVWAPDGSRAVFLGDGAGVGQVTWDGVVTETPVALDSPLLQYATWSPNSDMVAFPAQEVVFGPTELFVLDGTQLSQVTSSGYNPYASPAWTWLGDGIALLEPTTVTWYSPRGSSPPAAFDVAAAALAEFDANLTCDFETDTLVVVQESPSIAVALLDTQGCQHAPSYVCTLFQGGVPYCVEGSSGAGLYEIEDADFPLVLRSSD